MLAAGLVIKLAFDYSQFRAQQDANDRPEALAQGEVADPAEDSSDYAAAEAAASDLVDEDDVSGEDEEALDAELEAAADDAVAEAAGDATSTQGPITAGQWQFNWRLYSVAGTQFLEPQTPRSSFPIGNTGGYSRCVNASEARSPGSIAFPMSAQANCRSDGHRISNGQLSGEFTCRLPTVNGAVDAAVNGDYNAQSVDVTMRMRVPASAIAKGNYANETVEAFYQLSGRRTGGC